MTDPAFWDMDPLEWMAPVFEGIEQAETEAMRATAGRLSRGIDDSGWAAAKEAEMGMFRHQLYEAASINYDANVGFVREAFLSSYKESLLIGGGPPTLYATNPRPILALADELAGQIGDTKAAILRQAEDVYRQTLRAELPGGLAGGLTRRQVTQNALNKFADNGVTGFVDRAGRKWDLASYTEMATRTGMMNAAVLGTMDAARSRGQDLMIVSDAFEECPICRPWERRVLSISGAPGYPSVDEARAAGLFHGNCRHSMAPYIKGLTTGRLTYRKEKPRFDTRADKDRMRQRHMERQIRKWKRRQAVAITPKDVALAAAKVRQWQGAIRTFTAQTGRRRLYYREGGAVPRAAATGESTLGVSRAAGYSHPKAARADELWELQAEKLAQRHGMTLAEWEAAANANYASILARSELSTQVDDYTLQLILADKRFKSQFETGTSMGLFSHEARSKAESNLFGVPANLPARERPIYGHMFDPEVGDIGEALSYGEVQVVFKPSVRSRTTITGMDSLELGDGEFTPSAKPSPLTNPSVRSVKVFDAGTESSFLHRDPLVATQLNKVHVSYTEAQIHGGVRTSDIDRVIFAHDPPSPQTERMLDEAGIPWVFDPDRDRL